MRLKLLSVAICLISITTSIAQPVNFVWSRSIGGKNTVPGSVSMARDANGDIYVLGQFTGSRAFGSITLTASGATDVFIAKMSAFGPILWAVKGGSSFSSAQAGGIAVSGTTIYVTGSFSNFISFGSACAIVGSGTNNKDVFIASLNTADGSCNWVAKGEGPYDNIGNSVTPASGGGVYLCGTYNGTVTFGSYSLNTSGFLDADLFYAKYSATGTCEWAKKIGGFGTEIAGDIKEYAPGQILMNGGFEDVITTTGGNVTSTGGTDFFLTKFNGQGDINWIVAGGGIGSDYGLALDFDTSGNIYSTGLMGNDITFGSIVIPIQQGPNALITKHNSTGAIQWVRTGGHVGDDSAFDLCADPNGSTYVTGYVSGNSSFSTTTGSVNLFGVQGNDSYVVKYNTFGEVVWLTLIGSPGLEIGKSIIYDASGNCFAAGEFDGTLSLTANPISAPGSGLFGTYVTKLGGGSVGLGEELTAGNLSLFPNPASSFVNIDLSDITDIAFTVELFDIRGTAVRSLILSNTDAVKNYKLSTEGIAGGHYVVRVYTSKGDYSAPLVISNN